jgi:heme-degrading monooxygenase HmoA
MSFQIAQFNIARIKYPLEHPNMRGFVEGLDTINKLADESRGFVWRLKTEDGNSTSVRPYPDQNILVTLSVWESVEDLTNFAYREGHAQIMKHRREWFEEIDQPYIVLWWIPVGYIPTVEEGVARLTKLQNEGATIEAFSFQKQFPQPNL